MGISIDHGLGYSLPLIIARSWTNGVNISPVGLVLRVNGRVPIDFGRRGKKHTSSDPFCQAEHVHCPNGVSLNGFDWIVHVFDRRGG